MRRTKIVATIGPKTESPEMLKALTEQGVNVFRLNFSHGDHEWHGRVIERIKKLNKTLTYPRAIMLDTKGPAIRTGDLRSPIMLKKGGTLILTVDHLADYESIGKVSVNYDAFIQDVSVGDKILVDNGLMTLKVSKKQGKDVFCEVLDGGELGSRRHLNLPGKEVSLASITDKDWKDIHFGIKQGVDFIALSFVRSANEIREVKKFLEKSKSDISLIAKIETTDAVERLGSIFEAADGVMVARGDLGAEIPFAEVPIVQWDIARMSGQYRKPVIVATQMLESMQHSPMPTRAEVTDVFAATWQRNDAVMLSGETASGDHPLKCVDAMRQIILATEKNYLIHRSIRRAEPDCDRSEFCKNASNAADDLPEISAIVVVTRSGFMANLMASFRPRVPILAMTNEASTCRRMQLMWGTEAAEIEFSSDPEKTIQTAIKKIIEQKMCSTKKGEKFVLLSDVLAGKNMVPALQIREF